MIPTQPLYNFWTVQMGPCSRNLGSSLFLQQGFLWSRHFRCPGFDLTFLTLFQIECELECSTCRIAKDESKIESRRRGGCVGPSGKMFPISICLKAFPLGVAIDQEMAGTGQCYGRAGSVPIRRPLSILHRKYLRLQCTVPVNKNPAV